MVHGGFRRSTANQVDFALAWREEFVKSSSINTTMATIGPCLEIKWKPPSLGQVKLNRGPSL